MECTLSLLIFKTGNMTLFVTADGQAFKFLGDARLHARSLEDQTIKEQDDVLEASADLKQKAPNKPASKKTT